MTAKTARTTDRRAAKPGAKPARREHDMVTLGIAFAAIILFVGTAGVVLPNLIDAWQGEAGTAGHLRGRPQYLQVQRGDARDVKFIIITYLLSCSRYTTTPPTDPS